jgi:cytoskeletal protein CcmA (bactofilin family)
VEDPFGCRRLGGDPQGRSEKLVGMLHGLIKLNIWRRTDPTRLRPGRERMWKKDEMTATTTPTPGPAERAPRPEPNRPAAGSSERATIGRSITIQGDVSGDEDLLIQGRVEGSVELKLQSVTVGGEGRVKADITGRVVIVEGEVEGDLKAKEQVILRSTARVEGDISAPRVVVEDGANFRGLVDMGEPIDADKRAGDRPAAQEKSGSEAPRTEEPAKGTTPQDSGKPSLSTRTTPGAEKDATGAAKEANP